MTAEPVSLMLRNLRWIDEKLDRVINDQIEVKQGLRSLEANVASVSRRLDWLDEGASRIERRLYLVQTH